MIHETVYDHDSLLYLLTPACDAGVSAETVQETAAPETTLTLPELMDVTLEEPNVLILDLAEAQFDDGPWQKRNESSDRQQIPCAGSVIPSVQKPSQATLGTSGNRRDPSFISRSVSISSRKSL